MVKLEQIEKYLLTLFSFRQSVQYSLNYFFSNEFWDVILRHPHRFNKDEQFRWRDGVASCIRIAFEVGLSNIGFYTSDKFAESFRKFLRTHVLPLQSELAYQVDSDRHRFSQESLFSENLMVRNNSIIIILIPIVLMFFVRYDPIGFRRKNMSGIAYI